MLIAQEADVLTGGEGSDTYAIDASAGAFDQSVQIIDFNANEDQIEIMLNEEDYEQGQKNIRIETNDDGSSVVYFNNEEVLVVNSETPLLQKDIVLTTASYVDLTALEDTDEITEGDVQQKPLKTRMVAIPSTESLPDTDLDDLSGAPEIDDQVNEYAGSDHLTGSAGEDHMDGGAGEDTLLGGRGEDNLHGGDGDDQIRGGAHADQLWGDMGDDKLSGNKGNDTLTGGAGEDTLVGNRGDDGLYGNDGNDHLDGGSGEDVLFGGNGNDHLEGGSDDVRDFLKGGRGDDLLIAQEADVLTGGDGSDTFSIDASAGAFDNSAQIIDFNENEDQIEIVLDETNFDQGLKNIRVEPNETGQSVVYLNNEAIVAINSETPLSLADIGFSKANT
ncbi:MAG: hypothetical protein CMH07_04725 [Marinovum sp.]|nr:hypothetical protein [Marinovum sp.]